MLAWYINMMRSNAKHEGLYRVVNLYIGIPPTWPFGTKD
jgi:hypothetical protein